MRIDVTGSNRLEGEPLGPALLPLPLFRGGIVESLRGDQIIVGQIDAGEHSCGLVAITMGPDCPAAHIGLSAGELRDIAAEMCRTATALDQGRGQQ